MEPTNRDLPILPPPVLCTSHSNIPTQRIHTYTKSWVRVFYMCTRIAQTNTRPLCIYLRCCFQFFFHPIRTLLRSNAVEKRGGGEGQGVSKWERETTDTRVRSNGGRQMSLFFWNKLMTSILCCVRDRVCVCGYMCVCLLENCVPRTLSLWISSYAATH